MSLFFCPKCLFTFFFLNLRFQLHVSVTHFLRQQKRHPITSKASPLREMFDICLHGALIDHLILCILGFCAAFSFNDGLLAPYPLHVCPLQHAIPQRPLLHDAFFPLPTVQKHKLEAHSWLYQDRCRKYTVISLWAKSLPYGEEMRRIKSCLNFNGDGNLEFTSVKLLHKHKDYTSGTKKRFGSSVNNREIQKFSS